jgi:hypothetical protein
LCSRERTDARLLEQLRRKLASDGFDLACELAFFSGQLQHTSRDSTQRE